MKTERKKLAAIEIDALKRSCRILGTERTRNERIKEMIKINSGVVIKNKQRIYALSRGYIFKAESIILKYTYYNFFEKQRVYSAP